MTTNFRRPPPVDEVPRRDLAALIERFPQWRDAQSAARDADDDGDAEDEWVERFDDEPILLLEGDVELDDDWLATLADAGCRWFVVTGDARVALPPDALLYVGGDLHCHRCHIGPATPLVVEGRIVARDYVSFAAEDDESTVTPRPARIETPLLFSWFFSLWPLQVSPATAIFLLADHDDGVALARAWPNPVLNWHEGIHVLRDEMQAVVDASWHDTESWRLDRIRDALDAGLPVLRDGVSFAAFPLLAQANDLARIGERRAAFLQLRRAVAMAPDYYPLQKRMGDLLLEAGAFEQALACARRAVALFPQRQPRLADHALNDAALAALRAGRFADAVELATQSIARHVGDELDKTRASAHRLRGEALLRQGESDAARADLEAALALNPRQNGARWMLGLWHHLRGDAARARELHDAAADGDAKFAASYADHSGTDFLHAAPIHVDWDEVDLGTDGGDAPAQDEAFWLRMIAAAGPNELLRVPAALRSAALCRAAVDAAPEGPADFASVIPAEHFTREMARQLARRGAANLAWIPDALIDKALCLSTPPGPRGFSLADVPASVVDAEICLQAIRCGEQLANVPAEYIDEALCHEAVRQHVYAIDHVPPALRSEALYVVAIAHGGRYYVDTGLPSRWRTNAMFKRAISLSKTALDGIPGKDFDAELFAHAQAVHGQDADWPEIVERHGTEACRRDAHGDAAEQCWRVFWDEAFMLEQIARDGYHLAPYEIAPELSTPAIAEACHRRDPIHLASLPRAFVTDAMCERFIRAYDDHLHEVPLARRSLDVCTVAVRADPAQLAGVPAVLHADVMDALLGHAPPGGAATGGGLLSRVKRRLARGAPAVEPWMLLERGRGELMRDAPDIARAEADLQAVADAPPADDDPARVHQRDDANYLLGYIAHRQGRSEPAEAWRRRSGRTEAWDAYAGFDPRAGKPVADFDAAAFDRAMNEVERAIESRDLDAAWQCAHEAERLLAGAGVQEPAAWAHVLDKQRWLSFELGRLDVNEAVCRAVVERLGPVSLWAYLPSHDAVRHALRAALHRLAMLTLEAEPPASLPALRDALAQVRRVFSLRGPLEDEDVLAPFREGLDALRERIAALEG